MSLLVAIVTSEMRVLLAVQLLPILPRIGIIGIILFALGTISSLVFGRVAGCAHTHAMRFQIPDCSKICKISLHKIVQIDIGIVEVQTIEVLGNLELCGLRSTLKRLHKFAHGVMNDCIITAVEFTLRSQEL